MYVCEKRRAAFICHPRTGSSALGHVLRSHSGFTKIGNHHSLRPNELDPSWTIACVVRNPLDMLVSWFYYHRHFDGGGFQEFLYWFHENPCIWVQWGLLYGLPYCNYTLRFENLQQDLDEFMLKIDHPQLDVPERNVSKRRCRRPWHQYYTGVVVPPFKLCEPKQEKEIPI